MDRRRDTRATFGCGELTSDNRRVLGFLRRLHARFTSGRPRVVVLTRFDESSNTWVEAAADKAVDRADLTVTTVNVWFDPHTF